jgi:hypothetical protein
VTIIEPRLIPPVDASTSLLDSLVDTIAEINRQNRKWGEQNHPDGTGPRSYPLHGISGLFHAETIRDETRELTGYAFNHGFGTWADILREEFFEALAEEDLVRLRTELLQVAGVAIQWAAAVGRRMTDDVNAERAGRGTDR